LEGGFFKNELKNKKNLFLIFKAKIPSTTKTTHKIQSTEILKFFSSFLLHAHRPLVFVTCSPPPPNPPGPPPPPLCGRWKAPTIKIFRVKKCARENNL